MSAGQNLCDDSSGGQHSQMNSLITLADLALNCSNSDRDHSYAVEKKSSSGILDEECLVQKEKDHTYAFSGRAKSAVHKTLPRNISTSVPRRSSSEENVSRNFDGLQEVNSTAGKYWTTPSKKSQSYEEILKQSGTGYLKGHRTRENNQTLLAPLSSEHNFSPETPGPVIKHLKIAGDLASPHLPRKDHTYAVSNRDADVEMSCDTNKTSTKGSTEYLAAKQNRSYSDHIYNKLNVSTSQPSYHDDNVIMSSNIPIWSRKSDHSYFTFDEPMREQILGLNVTPSSRTKSKSTAGSNNVIDVQQQGVKRDKPLTRSDHTYFSLA